MILSTLGVGQDILVDDDGGEGYTSIQDAIDNASSGDRILISDGEYFENILVEKPLELRGAGAGLAVITGSSQHSRNATITILSDMVSIIGMSIRSDPDDPVAHGVYVSANGFHLEDCTISDHDAGILIIGCSNTSILNSACNANRNGITILKSENTSIQSSNCSSNEENGISVSFSNNTKISDSLFTWNNNGIEIKDSFSAVVSDNQCSHNGRDGLRIEGSEGNILVHNKNVYNGEDGISLVRVNLSQVISNDCTNNTKDGINLFFSSKIDLVKNDCLFNRNNGVNGISVNNILVQYMECRNNSWNGIRFSDSDTSWVMDNQISGNVQTGIQISSSSHITVANNTSTHNSGYWASGIWIDGSDELSVTDNTFSYNRMVGMGLVGSNNHDISGNDCSDNGAGSSFGKGIYLYRSNLNSIVDNVCMNNTWCGIFLEEYATLNELKGNIISHNRRGIELVKYSKFNMAENNEIFGNWEYGVYAMNNGNYTLNATNNWWNTDSGPFHPTMNNKGTGDNVTNNVIFFPWINFSPHVEIISPGTFTVVAGIIQVKGSAWDRDSENLTIQARIHNGPWIDVSSSREWNFSINTSSYQNGELFISVRSYDANEYSEEAIVTVFVNNPPPMEYLPDFQILSISIDPHMPYLNSLTKINVEIWCGNGTITEPVSFGVYYSPKGYPGDRTWIITEMVQFTTDYSKRDIKINWTSPAAPGQYVFGAFIDYQGEISELNEFNNKLELDLIVLGILENYGVQLQILTSDITMTTLDTRIEIAVWNIGEHADSYYVSALVDHSAWTIVVENTTIQQLHPNMKEIVILRVTGNSSTPPPDSIFFITITVRSVTDTNAYDTVILQGSYQRSQNERKLPIPDTPVVISIVGVGIFLAVFVSFTEVGKYAFLSMLFPLLARLHRDKILQDFNRGRIMGFIEANPGASYTEIMKSLLITNGTLTYHLNVLERERFITSKKEGIYKLFYPRMKSNKGISTDKNRYFSTGFFSKVFNPSTLQVAIIKIIKENPGITQLDIAEELGVSKQSLNYHTKMLKRRGLIKVAKIKKHSHCYINEKYDPTLSQ